jgi:sortase A
MTVRPKKEKRSLSLLLIVTGVILLLAGSISLLPSITAASEVAKEGTPSDFGEEALPLRPTVTPPPFASQLTPEPAQLPITSSQAPNVLTRREPARQPTAVDPADSIPTRIVIPAIKLDAPVETVGWHIVDGVSQWDVPNTFATGWLKTSAVLGQPGNTAVTGHHNVGGEVFRDLVKLKPGDQIMVYAQNQLFSYEVQSRRILPESGQSEEVRRANARWIQPTTDERITLITCWPYTSNTHRLVIVAKPVLPEKGDKSITP